MGSPNARKKVHLVTNPKPSGALPNGTRKIITLILGVLLMGIIYFILPGEYNESAKIMLALLVMSVFYWTFEPVPLGVTAILLLILMILFNVVSKEVIFSGFSSPALFLIIGGMMLAKGVNDTPLAKRLAYIILAKWGGTAKGLLGSIILIPQIQAFFIPAAAVRATLLIPVALMSLDTIGVKENSNLRKMILLGVAFAGTISGTVVMTAAIGNILTVELLKEFLGIQITYIQWFTYTVPIWLLLIPVGWFILLKSFPLPKENKEFPHVKEEMKRKLDALGKVNAQEKKCLSILILIVGLWFTEPFHGLHPSIPALIGVILMAFPGIGCAKWESMVKINFDTILLMGVTLTLGYAFNQSGAAELVGGSLSAGWLIDLLRSPIIAVITILIITQILHLVVANVSTAVVTLIPIFIGLSVKAGADPVLICVTASLACLHGYILVVEATPNIVVYSTGQIQQKDFLLPGLWMTLAMIAVTVLTAATWWNWIGLL
ncbi:DASS family sodium-coupled anion symporter [Cytobacillus depressus]|uniref:Sodium-dependent dicarboxylate transporter SdcS n=1 Tax=Cytobacillus depressus TaxID=1602942 RepID=A0A6L3V2F4_9BACI|nr:DASS family sodium-coupled anion symporter [Cytobacillus depressus]KAB2330433.1 DASS family sodium-coupled anion symporter [Cytobacillus depressus]